MSHFLHFVFIGCFLTGCASKKELVITNGNPHVVYQGRIHQTTEKGAELYWPGSSVGIEFVGTEIHATLQDEKGDNYFQILLDGKPLGILHPTSQKQTYLLASGLNNQKHHVEIFKRTEFTSGKTNFYDFVIKNNAKTFPNTTPKKRFIEFYGDSVTAGHGLDDSSGKDSGEAKFYNNYLAYGAITARHFNADYQCVCKGGIGLMISWFPYTMPDVYNKLNPLEPNSPWDFNTKTPDIVVINLMQNDSWLIKNKESKEFKTIFGDTPPSEDFIINSYKSFIQELRKKYPKAHIICALGSMDITKNDSKWPGYVESALQEINDPKNHFLLFPFKNSKGHPNKTEQQIISNFLIEYIEKNIPW